MAVEIRQLTPVFGAEVQGIDLSAEIDDATFAEIRRAVNDHAVLVFPGQDIDDDAQIAFSTRFGALEIALARDQYGGVRPEITRLANVDDEGVLMVPEGEHTVYMKGNQLWHTDSSFKPVPAALSILSAREVPPDGGETEFADTRNAYDSWPGADDGTVKADLEGLVCEHSIVYSRSLIVGDIFSEREKREMAPVQQILVRTHPESGRKCFYVGSHCSHIVGWPLEKGRALTRVLTEWCVRPERVYTHRWRPKDLVIWDNRCVLHRGRPHDPMQRRVMHRTTVAGDGPTVPA